MQQISRTFSPCKSETLCPLDKFLFPPPLVTSTLPLSLNLTALGTSYKRNHTGCLSFCVWFISLNIMSSSFIYVIVCVRISFLFFFAFLGPHPRHREVPRLGVESELQLPAYTTAAARPDPSLICDLHHSSQQRRILNPPNEVRDRTHILIDSSGIRFHCTPMEIPPSFLRLNKIPSYVYTTFCRSVHLSMDI